MKGTRLKIKGIKEVGGVTQSFREMESTHK